MNSLVQVLGTLVIPVVLPLLVGLVTTRVTEPGVKAVLLAALTLTTQLCVAAYTALSAGEIFDFGKVLNDCIPAFVTSVASHYGLWKPIGAAEVTQDFGTGGRYRHLKREGCDNEPQ